MKILGIETSCDETAAAVVEDGTKILSNVVASSYKLHKKTGGIIPEVAAREQVKLIIPVIEKAIKNCKLKIENLEAIAVTVGPGLIGSLLVGVETAKTFAYIFKKPIIPINHLLAHIYANWIISSKFKVQSLKLLVNSQNLPKFPAIALIASGGHTELVFLKNHGEYQWLGGTRDDAAGEAFDKIARILGLEYPGGPAIAKVSQKFKIQNSKLKIKLPRPMIDTKDFDFSFSGLKTAVFREIKHLDFKNSLSKSNKLIYHLAYETQEAITDVLVEKTIKAAREKNVKQILLAGGVTANQRLREKFFSHPLIKNYQLFIPDPSLCTDNAAMVASCAFFNFKPVSWKKIKADSSLEI